MGTDTTFLDEIYEIVHNVQRNWHIRNNILEIVMCGGCNEKPAIFSKKHCVYKCCSPECTRKMIGKKAAETDHTVRVERMKSTMIKNLGPDPYQKIYKKLKETNLEKYGNENPAKSEKVKSMMKKSYDENFINTILPANYRFISRNEFGVTLVHKVCGNEFTMPRGSFDCRKSIGKELCHICNPKHDNLPEKEICDFLDSIGVAYIRNTRSVIKPYELDIYLPDHKLAIEHNGIYFHSELFVDDRYHQEKRLMCEKQNIHLVGIWEDEWKYKKDQVKALLCNFLKINIRIGARELAINQVDRDDAKIFLNNNHLQGYVPFTIGYGLYRMGILMEIMTFTKNGDGYELSRLCTKTGYTVQGGANRLFKRLRQECNNPVVVSYCDLTKFNGNVYRSLGAHRESYVKPTYYYIKRDGVTIQRFHRRLFQKHILVSKGADLGKTEKQIMNDMGYYRIFNAGNLKFVYS